MQLATATSPGTRAVYIVQCTSPLSSPLSELVKGAEYGDVLIRPDFAIAQLPEEVAGEFEKKRLKFADVDFKLLFLGRVDLFASQLASVLQSCKGSLRLVLPVAWKALPRMRLEQFAQVISQACGGAKIVFC